MSDRESCHVDPYGGLTDQRDRQGILIAFVAGPDRFAGGGFTKRGESESRLAAAKALPPLSAGFYARRLQQPPFALIAAALILAAVLAAIGIVRHVTESAASRPQPSPTRRLPPDGPDPFRAYRVGAVFFCPGWCR
jgi:hypothetical protein